MLEKIYDVAFGIDGDTIDLEQDMGCGEVHRITLHHIHLRHLAEQAGLIAGSAHAEPDAVVARLVRQLRLLHTRIKHLDECLWAVAGNGREDLDHECNFSGATLDLADEFVADLPVTPAALPGGYKGVPTVAANQGQMEQPPVRTQREPTGNPRETHGVPESDLPQMHLKPPRQVDAAARGLSSQERSSLTKLVVGMAIDAYGYEPSERRSSAIPQIGAALRSLGIPGVAPDDDTVRKYVHEGAELHVPTDWRRADRVG
jgi:hypothetical protein